MTNLFLHRLREEPPLNIAHRGARTCAPENTLAAFHAALAHGADGIEFDVRLCRSHEWVVFHDQRLGRTTNGHGYIRMTSLEKIRRLDAGIKFGEAFRSEPVPTLADALAMAGGRLLLNIEIKAVSNIQTRKLARLLELLYRHEAAHKCVLSSFNPLILRKLAVLAPEVPTGLILTGHGLHGRTGPPVSRLTGVKGLHVHFKALTPRFLRAARERGLYLLVWGANEARQFRPLIDLGVDGIITDEPRALSQLLGRKIHS
ncbi:MAG: glycerophosphodiester phosphodiesterase family protein [candidate division KSB1 bacterium]|nr:glycerophosphodiester phosphodiesterase family protein [candidate division KSB1 bacterium]MDZ7275956.1 glycerophosphodiester phosphodiesterase family protein [candidate division KSB1 bacterium]MDZ7285762.1 glycerophosphodiester phosphodiesterase family protein [candidate division KSB1 bacterium]MDZ7298794.1 glycerophosphodiester phosphodiesterase family protein [candidate division KSB1 bacterium]MDZ7307916.1 glycerophosphodiester phosphodiesterase family protein [candidate division KSB1 bact